MAPSAILFVLSFLACLTIRLVSAELRNVTIDDASPAVDYYPLSEWNARPGACSSCQADPDASQAYDGTWHDTSYDPGQSAAPLNATLTFNGSAVYVYCIISHSSGDPDGNTDLHFMIDDDVVGSTNIPPTGLSTYSYNYLVYSGQFPMGQHTLTVVNGQDGGPWSMILLDYIIYTAGSDLDKPETTQSTATDTVTEIATSSGGHSSATPSVSNASDAADGSKSQTHIIVIVAVVVGTLLILAVAAFFALWRYRSRGRIHLRTPEPFDLLSSPLPGSETQMPPVVPSGSRPILVGPLQSNAEDVSDPEVLVYTTPVPRASHVHPRADEGARDYPSERNKAAGGTNVRSTWSMNSLESYVSMPPSYYSASGRGV